LATVLKFSTGNACRNECAAVGPFLSDLLAQIGRVNSARYFMRREDYAERSTPPESLFRGFIVMCLKCRSHQVSLRAQFDEGAGEVKLVLVCGKCRNQEEVPAR